MLAVPGAVPTAPGCAFEFKWDGVRRSSGGAGEVRLTSRDGNDVTGGYPEIVDACAAIGPSVLLDGELVALDAGGRPDSGCRSNACLQRRGPSCASGCRCRCTCSTCWSWTVDGCSASPRRPPEQLVGLGLDGLAGVAVPPSFTDVTGAEPAGGGRTHRLEGVVAKRQSSRYEPGRRSAAWIKTALIIARKVLIGGWTPVGGGSTRSARCCSGPGTGPVGCATWATSGPGFTRADTCVTCWPGSGR